MKVSEALRPESAAVLQRLRRAEHQRPSGSRAEYENRSEAIVRFCQTGHTRSEIAAAFGYTYFGVGDVLARLKKEFRLHRRGRLYQAVAVTKPRADASPPPPPAAPSAKPAEAVYIEALTDLARHYVWETGHESAPIKRFLAWLEQRPAKSGQGRDTPCTDELCGKEHDYQQRHKRTAQPDANNQLKGTSNEQTNSTRRSATAAGRTRLQQGQAPDRGGYRAQ